MNAEMASLRENDTYDLTHLPPYRKCIGGKWVYSIKPGVDNSPKFKAHYCAKGFVQKHDIDCGEKFAPTCRMSSIRMITQISVQNDFEIHHVDASSAFLHANVDRDLYVQQPRG